ncbi:BnaC04g49390D [Brassica napus]|uniref:(rape) hypothetical protein n=1 Tax=Brassica napus TaxID=3708 RepID=A0A078GDE2_BRANA|nr:unnamed protein product [Brassica napus]CDY23411.1 BnaC04g49390D [Brassica napus]
MVVDSVSGTCVCLLVLRLSGLCSTLLCDEVANIGSLIKLDLSISSGHVIDVRVAVFLHPKLICKLSSCVRLLLYWWSGTRQTCFKN